MPVSPVLPRVCGDLVPYTVRGAGQFSLRDKKSLHLRHIVALCAGDDVTIGGSVAGKRHHSLPVDVQKRRACRDLIRHANSQVERRDRASHPIEQRTGWPPFGRDVHRLHSLQRARAGRDGCRSGRLRRHRRCRGGESAQPERRCQRAGQDERGHGAADESSHDYPSGGSG